MSSKTIGLTINTLLKNSNKSITDQIVIDQIRLIDAKISTAHSNGFSRIEHELPVNFIVNNLSPIDSQLLIYSDLLRMYITPIDQGGKGFKSVHIIGLEDTPKFCVSWVNGMTEQDRKIRMDLINEYTKKR
jgi:hypothetical protein